MLREARTLDAFLLRFDYEADAISSLRVNVDELPFNIADATRRPGELGCPLEELHNSQPKSSKVKPDPELSRLGAAASLPKLHSKSLLRTSSKVHYVSHIIPYDAKKAHIFLFETDSQAFNERYSELQEIADIAEIFRLNRS